MKRYSDLWDKVETVLAVVFPAMISGLTMGCFVYMAMGWELTQENCGTYFNISLIAGLVSAIYLSIKATIYVMETKYKQNKKHRKAAQILPFEKKSKLVERQSHIS